MNCKQVSPHLPLMVDDRLEEPIRDRVAAHVDACAACQAELADLRRAVAFLHGAPRLEPSADFKNAIMAAASSELASRRARATRRLRRPAPLWDRPALRWALAPAAAVSVLVGAWLYALAPSPVPMVAQGTPQAVGMAPAASMPGEELAAIGKSITQSQPGRAVTAALHRVVGVDARRSEHAVPAAAMMAMTGPRPAGSLALPTVAAKPFPATTGRVRPTPAVIGPVADEHAAPADLIAAAPRSTHAKPYRSETGDEVASGLAGGLLANEVVVADVMAKVAAESTVNALTPPGPSYKDVPRIAFAAPKPKPSGPSYDEVPRLVFPGGSGPAAPSTGTPAGNDSSQAPGAGAPIA